MLRWYGIEAWEMRRWLALLACGGGAGTVREVVAGGRVVVLAVVVARIDVDLGRAQPRRGVQHRVADPLGDGVAL